MRPLLRPSHARAIPRRLVRNFHATRPSPLIAEVLSATTGVLHDVHSLTGLPWGASIPLTAVLVRFCVAFPFQISARRHARRLTDLSPLLMSYKTHVESMRKERTLASRTLMENSVDLDQRFRQFMKERKIILYNRWGISSYARFFPFLQIPVWLSFMEGVRAICGVNAGLFRYFLPVTTGDSGEAALPGVEPTLATEGYLWFSDLLAGDPSGALPAILGLSIVLNVQSGWKTKTLAEASDYSDRTMAVLLASKISKTLCSSFGLYIACTTYITGLPAGMMLYWITSTNIATLQSLFIDKVIFSRKPLRPWAQKHVRVLRTGEKPPPNKSLLS